MLRKTSPFELFSTRNDDGRDYDGGGGGLQPLQSIFNILLDPSISIGAGMAGFIVLLVNRLFLLDSAVPDAQSRADIISVIACSALLLNVLSESDIVARDREPVALVGKSLSQPLILLDNIVNNNNNNKLGQSNPNVLINGERIAWLINTILSSTPSSSVHVIINKNVVGRGGDRRQ